MTGIYTDRFGLYCPDPDDIGWGELISENFSIIDGHLGGRISELADVELLDMAQAGDTIHWNPITEKWNNCRSTEVGIQYHQQLQGLESDSHGIYLMLDGTKPMTGNLDVNYNRIIHHLDPENPGDLVTKRYYDTDLISIRNSQYVILRGINDPDNILSYVEGDTYIVGDDPLGLWSGRPRHLAYWAGEWRFLSPREGMVVYVINEHTYYKFDGTIWVKYFSQISHHDLADLSIDDHTQYLNPDRHRNVSYHALGTVVPHDELSGLMDVGIDNQNIRNMDVLTFFVPPVQEGNGGLVGYWRNVPVESVGIQEHNKLQNREDINEEGYIIYDPNSAYYDAEAKSHPQYLTLPEHAADLHEFVRLTSLTKIDDVVIASPANRHLFVYLNNKWRNISLTTLRITHNEIFDSAMGNPHPQYIPWSTTANVSAELPDALWLGDKIRFKRSSDNGSLTLESDIQTVANHILLPDTSGTAMIRNREQSLSMGQVPVWGDDGVFEGVAPGNVRNIFMSFGAGQFPAWVDLTNYYDMLPSPALEFAITYKGATKWVKLDPPASSLYSTSPYHPTSNPKYGANDVAQLVYDKNNKLRWANDYVHQLDAMSGDQISPLDELLIYDVDKFREKRIPLEEFFSTKRTIILTAGSAIMPPSRGASIHTSIPENLNQICYPYIAYPPGENKVEGEIVVSNWFFTMPEGWSPDQGLNFILYWTPGILNNGVTWTGGDTNASGDVDSVVWGLKSWRFGEAVNLKGEMDNFVRLPPCSVGTQGQYFVRATPEFTPSGASFFGDRGYLVGLSVARMVDDTNDTYLGSADLLNVRIEFTTNTMSD